MSQQTGNGQVVLTPLWSSADTQLSGQFMERGGHARLIEACDAQLLCSKSSADTQLGRNFMGGEVDTFRTRAVGDSLQFYCRRISGTGGVVFVVVSLFCRLCVCVCVCLSLSLSLSGLDKLRND